MITRADTIVNTVFLINLIAPLLILASIRFAQKKKYIIHRNIQIVLLIVCFLAVLTLELHIRLSGGSGELVKGGHYTGGILWKIVFGTHVSFAIISYTLWTILVFSSIKQFKHSTLPGEFSRTHKRKGKIVFIGICFTSFSSILMYLFGFVF